MRQSRWFKSAFHGVLSGCAQLSGRPAGSRGCIDEGALFESGDTLFILPCAGENWSLTSAVGLASDGAQQPVREHSPAVTCDIEREAGLQNSVSDALAQLSIGFQEMCRVLDSQGVLYRTTANPYPLGIYCELRAQRLAFNPIREYGNGRKSRTDCLILTGSSRKKSLS